MGRKRTMWEKEPRRKKARRWGKGETERGGCDLGERETHQGKTFPWW